MSGSSSEHRADVLEATVIEELPNRLFRLRTSDGRELVAGPSEQAKRLGIHFRKGLNVSFLLSSFDPGRGIILGIAPTNSIESSTRDHTEP